MAPCPKVYEQMLQKLEGEVRKHFRVEHQLKLHIENLEDRVEVLERENGQLQTAQPGSSEVEVAEAEQERKAALEAHK